VDAEASAALSPSPAETLLAGFSVLSPWAAPQLISEKHMASARSRAVSFFMFSFLQNHVFP
jgi:hypothetical protein